MIYTQPNTDTNLGGTNPSNEHKPSQKAVKTYVNTSVSLLEDASNKEIVLTDSSARYPSSAAIKTYIDNILIPKSISILGPQKVYPRVSNVVNYRIIPEPGYAYSYYDASVTSTSNVIITNLDIYGFDVDFRNISSTQDVTLNLSVKTSNGDVLSAKFDINVIITYSGVGIQHIDTKVIYTRSEWNNIGFSQSDARGIAVGDGINSLCLWYKYKNNIRWSTKEEKIQTSENKPYTTNTIADAQTDFGGKANTDAILSVEGENASAAYWAKNYTFSSEAYLPAAGELLMICSNTNMNEISECSKVIGGNLSSMFGGQCCFPWSSTQYSATDAWYWDNRRGGCLGHYKKTNNDNQGYALGCVAL